MVKTCCLLFATATAAIALAFYSHAEPREYLTRGGIICVTSDTDRDRVRDLMLSALDDALKHRIAHLYEVWVLVNETEQPQRVAVGVRRAINVYLRSRNGVLTWDPPRC